MLFVIYIFNILTCCYASYISVMKTDFQNVPGEKAKVTEPFRLPVELRPPTKTTVASVRNVHIFFPFFFYD